jgi:hypothetical protein
MYATRNGLYDRSLEKTPEQLIINSLRREFESSPAESKGVLELAKSCLFGEVPQVRPIDGLAAHPGPPAFHWTNLYFSLYLLFY